MKLSQFDYSLPEELIAQEPARPRDKCRLLVVNRKKRIFEHRVFKDLVDYLGKDDVLVLNDSRVIPARIRLSGHGPKAEILLIRKVKAGEWLVMGRPGRLLREGERIQVNANLSFCVLKVFGSGQRLVRFGAKRGSSEKALEKAGCAPLPPYITSPRGNPVRDYQTVYAKKAGSVAAPTAGLHFTNSLLKRLREKGVKIVHVTLHVGPGTFLPVRTDDIRNHKMHSEWYRLGRRSAAILNEAYLTGKRIIAAGTTSVRVLESAFAADSGFRETCGETSIFIYPGYRWKCVSGIVTNFHLPKSTLLMLVSSFAGKRLVKDAYKEAVKEGYRFYSYGDAMLLS